MDLRMPLLAAVAGLTLAASAQAALVTSFESAAVAPGVQSTLYATDGTYSNLTTLSPTWWGDLMGGIGVNGADFKANTTLLVDYTVIPGTGNADWQNYCGITLWMQGDGLGWSNAGSATMNSGVLGIVSGTASINYSSLMATVPTNPGWFQMGIVGYNGNSAASMDIYLDNIRVVPEPTVLAGMGVATLSLMLRKRPK